ncbi:15377_t:CDS:10 [Funneliformis caledonium]|uniref:Adenylosuccinate synthetase n=1 Tax=Funneliformis caledonium TaxID=1117310 RepID=A0A9N9AQY7_9GLOM|nr:15377_t:CDS:10 [Funneliformis caledonium]
MVKKNNEPQENESLEKQRTSEYIRTNDNGSYPLPTGKALVETDTTSPSPHLSNQNTNLTNADYLGLILTSKVYQIVKETPLQHAINLSLRVKNEVLLKREDLHEVFSFKIRGAYNKIAHLSDEERARGVIACSAGNHAQGVAMSAKHLGLKATINVSATPEIKYRNVERLGAKVVLYGNDFDEAKQECSRLAEIEQLTNIPPYDDPYVIAGQGTIAMEIMRQHSLHNLEHIDAIFACVGGGGLIAGIGSYIKRLWPNIKIIGVETYDANAMHLSLKNQKRVTLEEVGLFADGAAVRIVGEETFRVCRKVVDEMIMVTTDEIYTRSIVEPAGALGVAGVKKYIADNKISGGIFVAVTSGANMNFDRLRFVAERAELGEQREALISVIIPERPGSFVRLYNHIYPRQITEFSYRYSDSDKAWIYMSFMVNNREQELPKILHDLREHGMYGQDISDNEMAKSHARYLVGGRSKVENERLYRFEFPERPAALQKFLCGLRSDWNISLFHYRNHGSGMMNKKVGQVSCVNFYIKHAHITVTDIGKVLAGIQVPPQDSEAFETFKNNLGYHVVDETDNPVYKQFLIIIMSIFSKSNLSDKGITVVLGSQWGDEGKGKLVDLLAQEADVCARCAGGNNAGHTIVVNGTKYDFHILPSGLINPKCVSVIGSGVVVHIPSFFTELEQLEAKGLDVKGRIFLSNRAHLVFDFYQIVDGLKELELGRSSIGTTKKGIGPAYSSKASRSGLRVHHLSNHQAFAEKFQKLVTNRKKRYGNFDYNVEAEIERYKELSIRLQPYVVDSVTFMHQCIASKKKILVEGANALMLDLDFGTYPFVTSSNTTVGGVSTGLGIPPSKIDKVIGVVKAYTTRVGGGPFPTELLDETGEYLQRVGAEIGATTGRKRRCGWLDLVVLKYSTLINGYTSLNLTKLDVLDDLPEIKIATAYLLDGIPLESFPADLESLEKITIQYENLPGWQTDISKCRRFSDLPTNAQNYVKRIEKYLEVPIEWIGVGARREDMIDLKNN